MKMTGSQQNEISATDPGGPPSRLPYMPGLDGLRAIAVIAVLLYHADLAWIPGGFLGVEVFFVISGYLITSLLLLEWQRTGGTDLKQFWARRARRLLPALFTVLIVTVAYALLFARDALYRMNQDVAGALGYGTNWLMIFRQESYFEAFGRPPLLRHLWSLAVEEQFYLLWPLLFVIGIALLGRSRRYGPTVMRFFGFAVVGVIASTVLMWLLYVPYEDPSRVYFGTDTRAAGILIGVGLAFLWQPWRFPRRLGRTGRVLVNAVGWSALGALTAIILTVGEYDPFLYRGGFLVTSLVTAALIAVTAHPEAAIGDALGNRILRWVGTRSYGIYLWHWPVFMVTRPGVDVTWEPLQSFLIRMSVTLLLAEASYRWIEAPIRRLGFRVWLDRALAPLRRLAPQVAVVWPVIAAVFVFGITIGLIRGSAAPPPQLEVSASPAADARATTFLDDELPAPASGGSATTDTTDATAAAASPLPAGPEVEASSSAVDQGTDPDPITIGDALDADAGADVVFIGDSVMLGARAALEDGIAGDVHIDATVSRQMKQVPPILERLDAIGRLGEAVVVHLGTNGPFNSDHFDAVMEAMPEVDEVFFVNASVPRRYEADVNRALAQGVDRWDRAHLLDWNAAADGHDEYFVKDGVHLTSAGRAAYAGLIEQALDH